VQLRRQDLDFALTRTPNRRHPERSEGAWVSSLARHRIAASPVVGQFAFPQSPLVIELWDHCSMTDPLPSPARVDLRLNRTVRFRSRRECATGGHEWSIHEIRKNWSRRRFLAVSSAAAAQAASGSRPSARQAIQEAPPQRRRPMRRRRPSDASAGVITGGIKPLMESMTARPLRYRPVGGEFVIRNGGEFFNRPIYGVSSATQSGDFRVDAGDLPDSRSIFRPRRQSQAGVHRCRGQRIQVAAEADEVVARYRPGRMIYEIKDKLLGKACCARRSSPRPPAPASWSRSMRRMSLRNTSRVGVRRSQRSQGQRNGDIGCERQPVSLFFQVRPKECEGNLFTIEDATSRFAAVNLNVRTSQITPS